MKQQTLLEPGNTSPLISIQFAKDMGLECSVIWVAFRIYAWACINGLGSDEYAEVIEENIARITLAFDMDVINVYQMVRKELCELAEDLVLGVWPIKPEVA